MKADRVIKTFKEIMVSLGFKDIDVQAFEGGFNIGFHLKGSGFCVDIDIMPAEIEVEQRVALSLVREKVKVQGWVITGYKQTHGSRMEPPETVDFEIGQGQLLHDVFNQVIHYYVSQTIDNHWESAGYEEMAEEEERLRKSGDLDNY